MKIRNLLLLFVATLMPLAHASVNCSVFVPSDSTQPENMDKSIFTLPVPPSPSADPADKTRQRFVIVKKDNSSAYEISYADLMAMSSRTNGFSPINDDSLVSIQETTYPGVYAVYISHIDASVTLDRMKLDAVATAPVTSAGPSTGPFTVENPNMHFSIACNLAP